MWRQLEPDDYDAVMALRQAVLSSLPDPDLYVREDDEETFVRGHLDVFGESLGYFDGDELVAPRSDHRPGVLRRGCRVRRLRTDFG